MDKPDIVTLEEPTAEFRLSLLDGLRRFSDPLTGDWYGPARDLCLAIRDESGAMTGGLWSRFYYDWLFVELLFVPESRRGQNLGAALLDTALSQTRAWGGVGVWLDTFSFQSRGFYERQGFTLFGEIAHYPGPHQRFFLSKRLDGAGASRVSHPAIERVAEPRLHHHDAISAELNHFNEARIGGGPWPDAVFALGLRDAAGGIDGGLWSRSYYDWLFVDLLVVPDHLRGRGIGTELLGRAEAEATAQGCVGVWLDTFSFQAPEFYRRHGYAAFGELDDYPAPHRRMFFKKKLRPQEVVQL